MSNIDYPSTISGKDADRTSAIQSHLPDIVEALQAIRNGYVQITIQDGRIVQIDRTEKRRLR